MGDIRIPPTDESAFGGYIIKKKPMSAVFVQNLCTYCTFIVQIPGCEDYENFVNSFVAVQHSFAIVIEADVI